MKTSYTTKLKSSGNVAQDRNALALQHSNHIVRAYASDPTMRGSYQDNTLKLFNVAGQSITVKFREQSA